MASSDMRTPATSSSIAESGKRSIIMGFTVAGATALLVFGTVNILAGDVSIGTFEIIVGCISIANVVLLRFHRSTEIASSVILFIIGVVLSVLFVTGGLFGTGLFWFFTFPVLSLYLEGTRKGTFWCIGLLLTVGYIFALRHALHLPSEFGTGTLLLFLSSFGVAFVLLYVGESTEEKSARVIDLQNKKLAQTADDLREFQLAVETAPVHIIMTDTDGIIRYANRGAEVATGYSRAEIVGKNASDLWGGQMPKEFYARMWHTIKEEKKTFFGELVNKRKNGETYTAQVSISPVIDSNGGVQFFVGIETDVSKQKELDRALLQQKEAVERVVVERTQELKDERARLLASINSLSFGFIVADVNHAIILKNPALLKILDISGDIVSIEDVTRSFGIAGVNSVYFNLANTCRQCINLKKTLEVKEVPYGQKVLRILCAPILGEAENNPEEKPVIGYVILVEDITEAKVMQRSRDEFFAVASHELRTPLTAIRGNADMILDMYADKIVDKDMKEMLTDIETSSIRLINIVNDFLEVSRLEQGRIQVKKETFDVQEIIEKVVRDMKPAVEGKGLTLSYAAPAVPLSQVVADRSRVEQILLNLVGNAVKFTREGGITIRAEPLNNFVKVQVIDTGIGISEQNQNLLFRKFQQAGEQMLARDVTQSTGLGLYICRHLISYMGGTIGIEKSELGKGSVFVFTLPAAS